MLRFLTDVFPSLSLEEYCGKAIGALPAVEARDRASRDADSARSGTVVRGIVVGLPGTGDVLVTTVDTSGAVTQVQVALTRPDRNPAELARHLATLPEDAFRPIKCDTGLIGLCGETPLASSAARDSSGEWASLVQATLPQVYKQAESFLRRKLEAMAEFAAGAGHEINNPAATIVGRAGQLLRQETDPERRRHLATIGAQAYRIRDMIGDAMLFARPPRPERQTVVVEQAIADAVASLKARLAEKSLTVDVAALGAGATRISADPSQFQVLLCELLRNAIEASRPEGRIDLTVRTETVSEVSSVEIAVRDEGSGLSAVEREHLFDPFFSGRQAGRGLGFGLPKAWQIARQHGATLTVDGGEGDERGTTFIVRLPLGPSES